MYIVDSAQQIKLISEMTQLRKDAQNFVVYYHHPYTNQMWKSFFPRATEDELGPKLLRHEPLPGDLREHLNICLKEDVPENAVGLGIELSVSIHKWPQIFKILEEDYSDYHRGQLNLFLKHLKVEEARKNINELDKGVEELQVSDKDLSQLAWRSRKLKMKRFFYLG